MAGKLAGPALKAPDSRKKGADLGTLIDTTVVGLFGLVAVATAHEHWLKERVEVLPITGPLRAWVDQLPAKTLKRVEQQLTPALLVVGLATVIGPDVAVEMRERAKDKSNRAAVSKPPQQWSPETVRAHQAATGTQPAANGAHEQPGGNGDWRSSIPPRIGALAEYDA